MLTELKINFENFLNRSSVNFMFVDGYSGIGKTSFAREMIREFNDLHNGETSVLLTQTPYIDNEREVYTLIIERGNGILQKYA